MIRPSEISRLAHRSGLGDKSIEKDYVLTWMLLAMAASPLRARLAFKGGTALKKVYVPDYRFSEDLDFTLLDDTSSESLLTEIDALYPWLQREVALTLAARKVEIHETGNLALYLNYVGPLRGDLSSRFFKADFTRNEMLVFPLRDTRLQVPYSDCQRPELTLLAYSPEEILAEKLCALLGRTEPRDLYDVHFVLANGLADAEAVALRLDEKVRAKGHAVNELRDVLVRKREAFSRLWELRLRGQMPDLPQVDSVIRETNRFLRQLASG